jgi:hypothetical protein
MAQYTRTAERPHLTDNRGAAGIDVKDAVENASEAGATCKELIAWESGLPPSALL